MRYFEVHSIVITHTSFAPFVLQQIQPITQQLKMVPTSPFSRYPLNLAIESPWIDSQLGHQIEQPKHKVGYEEEIQIRE